MSHFLLDNDEDDNNNDAKAIAIPRFFSENSRTVTVIQLTKGSNISISIIFVDLFNKLYLNSLPNDKFLDGTTRRSGKEFKQSFRSQSKRNGHFTRETEKKS